MLQISEGGYTALGKNTLVKRLLDERQKAKGKLAMYINGNKKKARQAPLLLYCFCLKEPGSYLGSLLLIATPAHVSFSVSY